MLDAIPSGQKPLSAPKIEALRPCLPATIENRQLLAFGVLFPEGFAEAPSLRETEALLEAGEGAAIDIVFRFLHTCRRQLNGADGVPTSWLDVDGKRRLSLDEAVLRETTLRNLPLRALERAPCRETFIFPEERVTEALRSKAGQIVGVATHSCEGLKCALEARAETVDEGLYRLRVSLRNTTPLETGVSSIAAPRFALLSTHIVLMPRDAKFVSLREPPEELATVAAACHQRGFWPALAGAPGERDIVLASPIILRDHPLSDSAPGLQDSPGLEPGAEA